MLGRSCALRAVGGSGGGVGKMGCDGISEKRHSLAPSCSRHPCKRVVPSGARTVTEVLLKTTRQSLLQILPMPKRLCLNDGMILASQLGRWSCMSVWMEERCVVPDASPTVTTGADRL